MRENNDVVARRAPPIAERHWPSHDQEERRWSLIRSLLRRVRLQLAEFFGVHPDTASDYGIWYPYKGTGCSSAVSDFW